MTTHGREDRPPDPTDDEAEAALWRLLDRAPAPRPVSPYFVRRVLREVNLLEEARASQPAASSHAGPSGWLAGLWQSWQRQPRATPAVACAAVALLLAGGAGLTSPYWHARPVIGPALVANAGDADLDAAPPVDDGDADPLPAVATAPERFTAQDVEVIADLDNLLSREESRLWTEDTARF